MTDRRGRPPEFDRERALEAVVALFWRHGYTATSVEMLVRATGLRRGSLYAAFGSKECLFLEALDAYAERMERAQAELFESASSPRQAIEAFFRGAVDHLASDEGSIGCLLALTGVERALGDAAAHRRVERHRLWLEASFAAAVGEGQARGEIAAGLTPRQLGRHFAHGRIALGALARMRPGRQVLADVVDVMLAPLDAPAHPLPSPPTPSDSGDPPERGHDARRGERA